LLEEDRSKRRKMNRRCKKLTLLERKMKKCGKKGTDEKAEVVRIEVW